MRYYLIMLVLVSALAPCARADLAMPTEQHGDVDVGVSLDPGAESGRVQAAVRIRASREIVMSLIKSCSEAFELVPGLVSCDVLETAPNQSWQLFREVVDYSWFVPKVTYEFRADYRDQERVSIERVSGDLKVLKASWSLEPDGDYTLVHYGMELAPGFWVPHWLIRFALRHDLPKMMRVLRDRAESSEDHAKRARVEPAAAAGVR